MKKILIVEDDSIIISILVFLLKKEGYEVFIAKDGDEGIIKIGEIKPDLIITDILMPYKSGLDLLAFSRRDYPSLPIIVISSLGKEDFTVIEAFKMGVKDFIAKPFNPIELVAIVGKYL